MQHHVQGVGADMSRIEVTGDPRVSQRCVIRRHAPLYGSACLHIGRHIVRPGWRIRVGSLSEMVSARQDHGHCKKKDTFVRQQCRGNDSLVLDNQVERTRRVPDSASALQRMRRALKNT